LTSTELVCPACGLEHGPGERSFCSRCGMPLVQPGGATLDAPLSEAHGRARKIDPRYTEGQLVRVAGGRNQAEAELIQGLLLEEGIPSLLRRTAGFDVPDFLAAGPRDVLVPEAGSEAARELLHQADLAPPPAGVTSPSLVKLIAVIGIGGAAVALVAWLLQGGG
jgi:Putative prokaryotic signal transducing protein